MWNPPAWADRFKQRGNFYSRHYADREQLPGDRRAHFRHEIFWRKQGDPHGAIRAAGEIPSHGICFTIREKWRGGVGSGRAGRGNPIQLRKTRQKILERSGLIGWEWTLKMHFAG